MSGDMRLGRGEDKRGGYPGSGSAETARPPRRLPSATHRPDPHGLRNLVGTGGTDVQTQNGRGEWVPAIPLPLYAGLRKRCSCGARFWTGCGYRGHYALVHILGQD